jgi:flagellar protein FliL
MAAESTQDGESKPKRNLSKLVVPIFAVFNLLAIGGGSFLVYQGTLGYERPTLREPAAMKEIQHERSVTGAGESVMYTMPVFTVNLDGTPRRMIRVEMAFEMLDRDGFEEIVRNSPAARDMIVRILNRKTFDDIETIQGKLFLKDEISVALNQSLKAAVIKDIYFNDFLVQ